MTPLERLIQAADARAAAAEKYAQASVDALARAAFAAFWKALQDDPQADVRAALLAAQADFGGGYAAALAEAFEQLLQTSISVGAVRAMTVGDVTLSRRLYLHATQTASEVTALVREHAKGVHQARELSLRLYDGYTPKDGIRRPLEGSARAQLPKALRTLTADPKTRRTLDVFQQEGQRQAARLKTPALRAAYLEAFEAWKDGAGQQALKRKLDVAYREKNRFFANRIAQTELHRAHQAQVARDLMDDEETTAVQVRMNPTHPRTDICDLHARADLYGLGPGVYPKPKAPRPPFHPFCLCKLKSRPSIFGLGAVAEPLGEASYLRTLTDAEAGAVMGSRERALRVLAGESAEAVINEGKAPAHRLMRVGDENAQRHPLMPERETATPGR